MPIVQVGQPITTIESLAAEVIEKVENRTSDLSRAYEWLRASLLEIAGNPDFRDDFDALEVLGPTFDLTIDTQEYDESNIIPVGNLLMATLNIRIFTDPPTNSIRRKLRSGHYQDADRFQSINGLPSSWYRFGDQIGFNPPPDKTYQVQARVLKEHPIAAVVQATVIELPVDWNEILCWSAAMRGFMEILEYEKAQQIKILLHGDPKYPDRPGIMSGRKKRREKEDWRQQKSLRPIIRRYGWGMP